ncbi:uncharacterized protein LOC120532258 isoform X2 [Polypterus senegalus]|uniref:uncharacterized protein LOC120532258 isoform X2 n=1 Tax=Polypterus senegalus TaxID=55291 RepID=UPI0019664F1E|nr:uncharacterized protein LOC120532258 isoform X2 [Polypterus senegalus]
MELCLLKSECRKAALEESLRRAKCAIEHQAQKLRKRQAGILDHMAIADILAAQQKILTLKTSKVPLWTQHLRSLDGMRDILRQHDLHTRVHSLEKETSGLQGQLQGALQVMAMQTRWTAAGAQERPPVGDGIHREDELAEWRQQKTQLLEETEQLRTFAQSLSSTLKTTEADKETLEGQLSQLHSEVFSARCNENKLRQELLKAEEELRGSRQVNEKLLHDLTALRQSANLSSEDVGHLRSERDALSARVGALDDERHRLTAQKDSLIELLKRRQMDFIGEDASLRAGICPSPCVPATSPGLTSGHWTAADRPSEQSPEEVQTEGIDAPEMPCPVRSVQEAPEDEIAGHLRGSAQSQTSCSWHLGGALESNDKMGSARGHQAKEILQNQKAFLSRLVLSQSGLRQVLAQNVGATWISPSGRFAREAEEASGHTSANKVGCQHSLHLLFLACCSVGTHRRECRFTSSRAALGVRWVTRGFLSHDDQQVPSLEEQRAADDGITSNEELHGDMTIRTGLSQGLPMSTNVKEGGKAENPMEAPGISTQEDKQQEQKVPEDKWPLQAEDYLKVTALVIELKQMRQAYKALLAKSNTAEDVAAIEWVRRSQVIRDCVDSIRANEERLRLLEDENRRLRGQATREQRARLRQEVTALQLAIHHPNHSLANFGVQVRVPEDRNEDLLGGNTSVGER